VRLEAHGQRGLLATYLAVTIGISLVVFRWLEEPARRRIRAWALARERARGARLGTTADPAHLRTYITAK
jgi:peptidoglycan/LPS O-acetylase OafA/YrhL